jgi:pimeloyl-ACP methyl ester carboxylesterase
MLVRMKRMPRAEVRSLRVARPDGAELAAEVIGSPEHPLVMLVAGADCAMDWWRPEFCAALVERGLRVVRYDQRGTGETTLGPVDARRSGLQVAADDALAVLEAAGASDAHWVGMSAGGWVAQVIALDHPERVRALTLMSTTPSIEGSDADLPGPAQRLQDRWSNPLPEPEWNDQAAVINYLVDTDRDYAGDEFDEAHDRAIWTDTVRRSPHMHRGEDAGRYESVPRWRERLGSIRVPTTVLHGTADPMFLPANGEALARDIPGTRFIPLPGIGHELPPKAWPAVIEAIHL